MWGQGGGGHLDGYVDVVVAVTQAHSKGAGGVRQRGLARYAWRRMDDGTERGGGRIDWVD